MPRIPIHAGRLQRTENRRIPLPPKVGDPHYHSPEHIRWRAEVLRRARYACQGQEHPLDKPRTKVRLFADHIIELRDGGAAFDPANGQALCGACHTRKTLEVRAERMAR